MRGEELSLRRVSPKLGTSEAKEADWEKRDRKENVVPTDSRSWYGWKRQIEKRRNDNECSWISEYVSLRLQR